VRGHIFDGVGTDVDIADNLSVEKDFYVYGSGTTEYVHASVVSDIPTVYGQGAYLRVGDAAATDHTLDSEDDLLVTGDQEVDGSLTADNGVFVDEYIKHTGDVDTYVQFTDDIFEIAVGNQDSIRIIEDGSQDQVVINEDGELGTDIDFRVEGITDPYLFITNAGDDNVGIGTASPDAKLGVKGDMTLTGSMSIGGNLSVSGTHFSLEINQEQSAIMPWQWVIMSKQVLNIQQ